MAEEERLDAEAAARHLGLPTRLVYAMVAAGVVVITLAVLAFA